MLADSGEAVSDLAVLRDQSELFGPVASPATAWRVLDNTGEALAAVLRPGRAGSNTSTDHIAVLDQALIQIPDHIRHGVPILVRTDTAGCTKAFLAHLRSLRDTGADVRFSVGALIDAGVREAIVTLPAEAWYPAIDADDEIRDGAEVADLTGLLDGAGFPDCTRFIVRRERPHPGAQLDLFDTVEGFRHQLSSHVFWNCSNAYQTRFSNRFGSTGVNSKGL